MCLVQEGFNDPAASSLAISCARTFDSLGTHTKPQSASFIAKASAASGEELNWTFEDAVNMFPSLSLHTTAIELLNELAKKEASVFSFVQPSGGGFQLYCGMKAFFMTWFRIFCKFHKIGVISISLQAG